MTARVLAANIGAFALQVAVLVAAAAALARVFRIDEPRAMLAYWRILLFACLVLPFCQPWTMVIPPSLTPAPVVMTTGSAPVPAESIAPAAARSVAWPIGGLAVMVVMVVAAGIAARLLWLTIGAFALRRLRRNAVPLDPLPDSVRDAQERIPTRARVCVSDRVSGPMTFGVFRPIVVLPPSVCAMPAHVQEAIAYHELLHVQRRDWLDEILEEAVRSVLWFHPAIWWLVGRIQLTREQVVDQAAIRLTDSRDRYLESLLAVARAGSPAAFAPVSAFLRRHLLKKRVARILQERTMTTRRLFASLTASAVALTLAAAFAARSFPLKAQGRGPGSGEPIQIIKGGEHLLHGGTAPEYPRRALAQKIEGDVVVEMSLNDRGEVSDARVLSGPDELRKTVLETVLQWHYSPSALSSAVTQATIRFQIPPGGFKELEMSANVVKVKDETPVVLMTEKALAGWATTEPRQLDLRAEYTEPRRLDLKAAYVEDDKLEENKWVDVSAKRLKAEFSGRIAVKIVDAELALDETFTGSHRLVDVRTERVLDAAARELLAKAGIKVGDVVTAETAKRMRQVALEMDEHFRVEFKLEQQGLVVTILTR
jgi:TonB family protein